MKRASLLISLYKQQKLLLSVGIAALVIISILESCMPMIIKAAIDSFSAGAKVEDLRQIALIYLAVALSLCLMRITWRVTLAWCSAKVGYELRKKYLEHLVRLPKSFFADKKTGALTSLGNSDIESMRTMFDMGTVIIIDAICGLIIPPLAMFYLSPSLALILLCPLLGIPLATYFFEKKIHKSFHAAQQSVGQLYAHMQESLEGIMVIKSFTKEHSMLKRFDLTSKSYIKRSLKLSKVEALFAPTLDLFVALSLLIHIIYGGQLVINDLLTLGTFVAFMRYLQMLAWPMKAVGLAVTISQKALVSSERLQEVFSHGIEPEDGIIPQAGPDGPVLKFENVNFQYPGTFNNVLRSVSFEVKRGEKVAILGDVGSGKSSLLSLIPALYHPSGGRLLVNGIETAEWNKKNLRSEISFVPQDVFLFNRNIKENISFGYSTASTKQIEKAADEAAILPEINAMPDQFETLLGQRGVNISGGQKQRLSIARALLKESPILVFDDALSAVDLVSERLILEHIKDKSEGRTVILSGQRISVVKYVDKVIVLRNGEIIQTGSPDELLADKGGWFYNFYEEQRIEEEINEQPV